MMSIGKKKGSFKTRDQLEKERKAEAYQERLYKQWGISTTSKTTKRHNHRDLQVKEPTYRGKGEGPSSLGIIMSNGSETCCKKQSNQYSGTLIKGICTMHKSNAIPVIDEEHIIDLAHMRR